MATIRARSGGAVLLGHMVGTVVLNTCWRRGEDLCVHLLFNINLLKHEKRYEHLIGFDFSIFPFRQLLLICKAITSSFRTFNQELEHQINYAVIRLRKDFARNQNMFAWVCYEQEHNKTHNEMCVERSRQSEKLAYAQLENPL